MIKKQNHTDLREFNPLTVPNGKFRRRLCMRNLVLTDISICKTNICQSEVFLFASQYFIQASRIGNQPEKSYNNAYSSFIHNLFLKISFLKKKSTRLEIGAGI